MTKLEDLPTFLKTCQQSGQAAYEQLKNLLYHLESPEEKITQKSFQFLRQLYDHFFKITAMTPENTLRFSEEHHFCFYTLELEKNHQSHYTHHSLEQLNMKRPLLLQLPSTFTPEEWSFTFYEGLARLPQGEFQGKVLCELGCGNGWITLVLAGKYAPEKIYGLDINPRAITCAKINLYLNAFDLHGRLKRDHEGKTLFDRVEFHTSDLLHFCQHQHIDLDRILGCIPQVLGPDPKLTMSIVTESSSDEFLHSLSNYCGKQGFIEDQFGLGLVARALEESVEVLRPSGKVILNLGGRPGGAILERLFVRRGFNVKKIWQKKVEQAGDTDISSLVEIENHGPHRFEFFMNPSTQETISAKTAQAYQQGGGSIFHSLTVYDAVLRHPNLVQRIMRRLKTPLYQNAKAAMDLSFQDSAIGDEKIQFLADLADYLGETHCFPYGSGLGLIELRQSLTDFLKYYFQLPLEGKSFALSPNRLDALKGFFSLYRPSKCILPKELARSFKSLKSPNSFPCSFPEIFESPKSTHLICDLVKALRPQMVVASLSLEESENPDSFLRLVEIGEEVGCQVIVDISLSFELGSGPMKSASGVFEFMRKNTLPHHVFILCGLIHNRVYHDLEMAFILSENEIYLDHWKKIADLSFCRTPLLTQLYYLTLIQELLKFQISPTGNLPGVKAKQFTRKMTTALKENISDHVKESFDHPALKVESLPLTKKTIRLDYGENELSTPELFKASLIEAFIRQNISPNEIDLKAELSQFLKKRFGLNSHPQENFFFGLGITPLFAGLMEIAFQMKATLIVPQGTYGYFTAMAQFYNVPMVMIQTHLEQSYKMTAKDLQVALEGVYSPWIFLNMPVVNPTGAIYSPSEVYELLSVANLYKSVVIIDSIFSGLEFSASVIPQEFWNLEQALMNLPAQEGAFGGLEFVFLGGISKELSAGGIRFGFAYTRSLTLGQRLREILGQAPHIPHETILFAVKKIYYHLNHHTPTLMAHLIEQKGLLKNRAVQMSEILSQCGWTPLPPQGGLFLVAKPTKYLGKRMNGDILLTNKNLPLILFDKTDLLINGSEWTGIPDYCRFVLSVDEQVFKKALEALKKFSRIFE